MVPPSICSQTSQPVGIRPASASNPITRPRPACLLGRLAGFRAQPPAATLSMLTSLLCLLQGPPSPQGADRLFLAHGKLCKGGLSGAAGVRAQVCLAHTHTHLQSTGCDRVRLGQRQVEALSCLSLCKMGVLTYVGAPCWENSAQNPSASAPTLLITKHPESQLREKFPKTDGASRSCQDLTPTTFAVFQVPKAQAAQPSGHRADGPSS